MLARRCGCPGSLALGTGEAKPVSRDPSGRTRQPLAAQGRHRAALCGRRFHLRGRNPRGLIVAIPRAERAALAEDEVYIGDLIGCTLFDVAGAEPVLVGEIEDVDRTAGPAPLLVVRGPAGEVLIPFAKSYLRKIDVAAKRVEMALPEGLVDLNASGA